MAGVHASNPSIRLDPSGAEAGVGAGTTADPLGEADAERLLDQVYDQLHAIARSYFRHQRTDHTLQPTAVVHEAFMKLTASGATGYRDRAHFIAVAARAMRQVLVDHARARGTLKRGGGRTAVVLDEARAGDGAPAIVDMIALDEALDRLADLDPRQARVVELRFIGGLGVAETAAVLGVSPRTVELDWRMARAWLSRALGEDP